MLPDLLPDLLPDPLKQELAFHLFLAFDVICVTVQILGKIQFCKCFCFRQHKLELAYLVHAQNGSDKVCIQQMAAFCPVFGYKMKMPSREIYSCNIVRAT